MSDQEFIIRNARPAEFQSVGQLMVKVYSSLKGFPDQATQPAYYQMLANVGRLTAQPGTQLLIAISPGGYIGGAVVYFSDMKYYGAGGSASSEINASGFRLLAVDEKARGMGLGKRLSLACIEKAEHAGHRQIIIHSTKAMKIAWKMYEKLGFTRSEDLDFEQEDLQVFGFRHYIGGRGVS